MKWYHKDTHPIVLTIAGILAIVMAIAIYFLASMVSEGHANRRIQLMNACDEGQRSACAMLSSEY